MNKSYQDIIVDILTIINYPKDKKVYAEDAEKSVFTDALINLSEKLPDDIKQHMEAAKTEFKPFTEADIEKVRQYISQEDLFNEIDRLAKEDIKDFVEELMPKLKDDQKQKLDAIVASLDEAPVIPGPDASAQQVTPPAVSQEAAPVAPVVAPAPQETPTQQ